MAKRYYQSKKDRRHERMGELRRLGEGYYDDYADRMRQEDADSKMIHEDRMAIANLPQNVMMKEYPKTDYASYDLNDTISVIDVQIHDDSKRQKKGNFPEKY